MSGEHRTEISAILQRADDSLRAARLLAAEGLNDAAASRAYYAAFYAATALLIHHGLEFGKHSGVMAAIHRHFVKPGHLDTTRGKELNWLFQLRTIGDYGEAHHVVADDAGKAVQAAERILLAMRALLGEPPSPAFPSEE
jgi:uncharacterized protein (UPF0332 family)